MTDAAGGLSTGMHRFLSHAPRSLRGCPPAMPPCGNAAIRITPVRGDGPW
ncbi:hypothetical protein [Novacetimonas hansenii]|nr:hypothetical protein [Novacetimonas hansenii]